MTSPTPVARLASELLHDMGQPLTILQVCRLWVGAPQVNSESMNALLPELADQVERLTELYRGVRTLFEAEAGAMDRTRVSLTALVRGLEPEWQRCASRRDVRLSVETHDEIESPSLNASRGEGALACLFDAVLASVPQGGHIRISLDTERDGGGLEMEGGSRSAWTAASAILSQRIAAALLEAESSRIRWNDSPMRVRLELPWT